MCVLPMPAFCTGHRTSNSQLSRGVANRSPLPAPFPYERLRPLLSPQYLHGWFALDFITCIPIDVIFGYLAQAGQWQINSITFRLLRMLRILKLARIVRASRIISRWQVRLRARTRRPLCSRRPLKNVPSMGQ